MKKNYLHQWLLVLLFLMAGCRTESYSPEDSADVHHVKKFRIIPKSEIPKVINTLQANTNNFKISLKNSVFAKGKSEIVFGDITTSYIVESTDGSSEIYYTFPILPRSGNNRSETYNLEVKTDHAEMASAKVVVYEPTAEWTRVGDKDYSRFSGNVSKYSLDVNLESSMSYFTGIPICQHLDPCPYCPAALSKLPTEPFIANRIPASCDRGGGVVITFNTPTPCEKTKALVEKMEVRDKIDELYSKSKAGGEKAFMIKDDGTPSDIINSDEHNVILNNMEGNKGVWHNHTPDGIKMASVRDILLLFGFIKMQPQDAPVTDAFVGMAGTQRCEADCPDGFEYFNYVIRFNGTAQEAHDISAANYDFDTLRDDYKKFEMELRNKSGYSSQYGNYISAAGLEEVFFDALDNMGIDKNKMILQRIDKNGNVTNVTLGSDGKPTDMACP